MALRDLVRCSVVGTPGTGPITIGNPDADALSFELAGVFNGEYVTYGVSDGNAREIGVGQYNTTTKVLTRVKVRKSTSADTILNLSAAAKVFLTSTSTESSFLNYNYMPGRYYTPGSWVATSGATTAVGLTIFRGVQFRAPMRAVSTATRVATAQAGGLYRYGLYASDPKWFAPVGAPIFEYEANGANASVMQEIACDVFIDTGLYFQAFQSSNASIILSGGGMSMWDTHGFRATNTLQFSSTGSFYKLPTTTGVYSTLPVLNSTFTGVPANDAGLDTGQDNRAGIGIQFKAG
jgi:hypothetical protein